MSPRGPAFGGATGFLRFFDRLITHGLEAFRLYYGIYRAQVVDEADSQHQGRIRVRVPSVGDRAGVSRLAYPSAPAAGNGYGFKDTPPKDSWVWVFFEGGRLDTPVWMAGVWGRDHVPEALRDPKSRGWITPGGHKLLLDERDGEEFITIQHKSGHKFGLDKDGNVAIEQLSGKSVFVGKDAREAAILGDTLKGLLSDLIDALTMLTVGTGTGPSSVPINVASFLAIKVRLEQILSQTVKVK